MKNNRGINSMLYAISFLGQLSMAIMNLGLVFYMRSRFSLDTQYIGLLVSLCQVMYLAGLLMFKHIVATVRPILTIGLASLGMILCGTAIIFYDRSIYAFFLYGLYGLFMSIFWPPIMGLLSRGKEGRELGKSVSSFNLAWSCGIIIGPYIAGLLCVIQPQHAIWAAGIAMLMIFAIVLAVSRLPEVRDIPSGKRHIHNEGQEDNSTFFRYLCWTGIFTGYFVFGITMNIFPVYGKEMLGYSESSVGLFLLIRGLVTTLFFVLLGRTRFWHFKLVPVLGVQMLLILSLAIGLNATGWLGLTIFFILFGVSFAMIYTNSIFHGAAGSINREFRMALHELFLTLGCVSGSLAGGYVYQHWSFRAVLYLSIVISAAAAVLQASGYIFFHRKVSSRI